MTDEKQQATQDNGTAGTDGNGTTGGASEPRTFTQDDITRIIGDKLRKEREKHEKEVAQLRETLTANIERNQHLEFDAYQVDKQREELEELREYKANRERQDMLSRISEEFGGVPIDLLRGDTEEELYACAGKIRAYADTFKPQVPETRAAGATPAMDSIASLYNTTQDRRERIERMAERHAMFG